MEALPEFELHRPATIAEALTALAGDDAARLVAGGTDLIVNMRRGLVETPRLVDLGGIAEMRKITVAGSRLTIGAGVTLDRLAGDARLAEEFPAIVQAAAAVAGPTHRNVGTVGGNLCLDTRCLFYNQSQWWRESNQYCLKYRGDVCHVAPRGKFCYAVFSGDLAPALLVHAASVTIAGPAGERNIPLTGLYRGDGADYLTLGAGEIVTAVTVGEDGMNSAYRKARIRGSIDFPLAGVAVAVQTEGDAITALRAALTACDTKPFLVTGLEDFTGKALAEDTAQSFGETVQRQARPMRTTPTSPWYRRRVVARLARRLLLELGDG
ncbi:MAG: 4-hydroxybenzoyl-CoA reductase subunit beta [Alphaproteobacteria bacterium]